MNYVYSRTAAAAAVGAERSRLIRLVHIAKRDLTMDDAEYRSLLDAWVKKDSAADMTIPELEKVLRYLKSAGFRVRKGVKSRTLADYPEAKKIRALWLFLHQLELVKNPSEAALAAYVKRIAGVDALQWIDAAQAGRIIETLKKWAMRELPKKACAKTAAARDIGTDDQIAALAIAERNCVDGVNYDRWFLLYQTASEILAARPDCATT
jgi:phage gp16-like protein